MKKRRKLEHVGDEGWEEFVEYVFPEEEHKGLNLKIMDKAAQWKQKMKKDFEY